MSSPKLEYLLNPQNPILIEAVRRTLARRIERENGDPVLMSKRAGWVISSPVRPMLSVSDGRIVLWSAPYSTSLSPKQTIEDRQSAAWSRHAHARTAKLSGQNHRRGERYLRRVARRNARWPCACRGTGIVDRDGSSNLEHAAFSPCITR